MQGLHQVSTLLGLSIMPRSGKPRAHYLTHVHSPYGSKTAGVSSYICTFGLLPTALNVMVGASDIMSLNKILLTKSNVM